MSAALSLADLEAFGRSEVHRHLHIVPTQAPDRPARGVTLTRVDAIRPEPIAWLWPGWLARGKLHLVAGAPGTGKTTLGLNLAALLTTGGRWPDGAEAPRADVALWSGEDTAADVLVPRLLAAGADPTRMHLVSGFRTDQGSRPFDPSRDIPELSARLAALDPALLIVDPLVSAVTGDSHRNAEVRQALQPLVDLATARGIAVLGMMHFSKATQGRDTVERINGSIGFGALARLVLATAKTEDGCILVRAKSNIGPDGGGFCYRLLLEDLPAHPEVSATRVVWGEALEGDARALLGEVEQGSDAARETSDVETFIRGCLTAGPVSARQMQDDARDAGYSWDRVKRCARRLGVQRCKEGYQGSWLWRLPGEDGDPKECKGSTHGRVHSLLPLDDSAPQTPDEAAAAELRRQRGLLAEHLTSAGWSAAEVAAELEAHDAVMAAHHPESFALLTAP